MASWQVRHEKSSPKGPPLKIVPQHRPRSPDKLSSGRLRPSTVVTVRWSFRQDGKRGEPAFVSPQNQKAWESIQPHSLRRQLPPAQPPTVPRAHAPKQLPPSTHTFCDPACHRSATFYSYQHYLRHAILIATSIAPHLLLTHLSFKLKSHHNY